MRSPMPLVTRQVTNYHIVPFVQRVRHASGPKLLTASTRHNLGTTNPNWTIQKPLERKLKILAFERPLLIGIFTSPEVMTEKRLPLAVSTHKHLVWPQNNPNWFGDSSNGLGDLLLRPVTSLEAPPRCWWGCSRGVRSRWHAVWWAYSLDHSGAGAAALAGWPRRGSAAGAHNGHNQGITVGTYGVDCKGDRHASWWQDKSGKRPLTAMFVSVRMPVVTESPKLLLTSKGHLSVVVNPIKTIQRLLCRELSVA